MMLIKLASCKYLGDEGPGRRAGNDLARNVCYVLVVGSLSVSIVIGVFVGVFVCYMFMICLERPRGNTSFIPVLFLKTGTKSRLCCFSLAPNLLVSLVSTASALNLLIASATN